MKKIRLSRALPWAVLFCALAVSAGVFALYGMHNLDADMSSEMVLAQLLNEEGGVISPNWYYSTELRVVSPVPVYQLGLALFGSWHAARTFSVVVLLAGVAASLIYCLRGAGVKDAGVFAAAAIILPFSEAYIFLFTYGGFYTVYFMAACWVIGLLLRLERKKGRIRRLAFIALAAFWCGLSGVRMIMILGAPLLLACALLACLRLARAERLSEMKTAAETRLLAGALLVFVLMAAGYLVNSRVLAESCHFTGYGEERIQAFSASMLLEQLDDLFLFFGLREGKPLLSIQGAASMLAIPLALAVLGAPVLLVRKKGLTLSQRLIPAFSLCAIFVGVMLNGVTGRIGSPYAAAYFMAGLLFAVVCLFLLMAQLPVRMPALRTLAMVLVFLAFALEARCFIGSHYNREKQPYEEAADYLVEQGYTKGYASYWFANLLTEASDGRLDVYSYDSFADRELGQWLQRVDHHEHLPEGKVFVYVDDVDTTGPVPCAKEDHLEARTPGGAVYAYDSAEEVQALQRERGKTGS